MAIPIECPLCAHKGNVPDKFDGKQVKCPECCNLFFASSKPLDPTAAGTGGSHAGTQKSPTSGSQAGTMKSPTAGSQAGTMKSPTAPGTKKLAASSQGATKKPVSAQGVKKKPGAKGNTGDPFSNLYYEEDTSSAPTYRQRRRKKTFKNLFALMFILGSILVMVAGGGYVYLHFQAGGDMKSLLAKLMPKKPAVTTEEADTAAETKSEDSAAANPEKKDPEEKFPDGPLVADVSTAPAKIGDVQISVVGLAYIVPPGKDLDTKDKRFLVKLRLENTGTTVLNFEGWGTLEQINEKLPPLLLDEAGQPFKRVTYGPGKLVDGQVLAESIQPGKAVEDVIVFEVPTPGTPSVKIELATINFGGKPDQKLTLILNSAKLATAGLPKPEVKPEPKDEQLKELAVVTVLRGPTGLKGKPEQKLEALAVLTELGEACATAVPDILPILEKEKAENLRLAAAGCLAKFGQRAKTAIPALLERVKSDESAKVRAESATALGKVGAAAVKDTLPMLNEIVMKEKDEMVLTALKEAIKELDKVAAAKKP